MHLFMSLNFVTAPDSSKELNSFACFDTTQNLMALFAVSRYFLKKVPGRQKKTLNQKSMAAVWKCFERLPEKPRQKLTQQWRGWQQTVGWLQRPPWLSATRASDWQPPLPPARPVGRDGAQIENQKQELLGESRRRRARRDFSTLVSSCALARLSTAMAKNTLSRVSGETIQGLAAYTWHNSFVYRLYKP